MTTKTEWRWLLFSKEDFMILPHAARGKVRDYVVWDLEQRGCALVEDNDLVKMNIDQPGMVAMDRPWESFQLDSLTIEMPCEDIATFVLQLESVRARPIPGTSPLVNCYKLHGFHRALCLDDDDRASLLQQLRDRLPSAEARAAEFWAGRKLPSEVLREAAALTSGQPLESIPNLGGNKQDRFRLKSGGKA